MTIPADRDVLNTTNIASRTRTILVIDDEDEIRNLVASVLRRRGHNVLEASNPADALGICDREELIDLVVSDYNMPGESGFIFAEKLRKRRPSIPVIFMSGNAAACEALAGRGFFCLQKPFDLACLQTVVQRFAIKAE